MRSTTAHRRLLTPPAPSVWTVDSPTVRQSRSTLCWTAAACMDISRLVPTAQLMFPTRTVMATLRCALPEITEPQGPATLFPAAHPEDTTATLPLQFLLGT